MNNPGEYARMPDAYTLEFSWYKGITILLVILLGISNMFFSVASIYDGMSRNTFLVGPYFVSYIVVVGVLGILTALFYILYYLQMYNGNAFVLKDMNGNNINKTPMMREQSEEMGTAHALYPRYTWDVATFFTATLVIYIFTLGMWSQFIVNQGYNYNPNFNLAINDEGLLEYYFVQFATVVLSLAAFIYCVDFLWVIAVPGGLYPLRTLDYIIRYFNREGEKGIAFDKYRVKIHNKLKREDPNEPLSFRSIFYPGASKHERYKNK